VDAGRAVVLAYVGRLGNGKVLRERGRREKRSGVSCSHTPLLIIFCFSLSHHQKKTCSC